MPHPILSRLAPVLAALVLAATPLAAQGVADPAPPTAPAPEQPAAPGGAAAPDQPAGEQPAPTPENATEALENSTEVEENQPPEPDGQGTRDPMATPGAGNEERLYDILAQVRRAPPALDGTPVPRPNALASGPTTEMTPAPTDNLSMFPEGYVE